MSEKKEFQLFDNYEEDGQLSLFSPDYDDWDEEWVEDAGENTAESAQGVIEGASVNEKNGAKDGEGIGVSGKVSAERKPESVSAHVQENSGPDIRVKYCSSCGKLLFVREEATGFHSECNNCGVKYVQKL